MFFELIQLFLDVQIFISIYRITLYIGRGAQGRTGPRGRTGYRLNLPTEMYRSGVVWVRLLTATSKAGRVSIS
jgi:hypothetical protein